MDFKRHPPMITPLLSAAALMLMGGFLIHRMHPGGLAGALRGEKPKAARNVTIVPEVVPEPDPVAWGDEGIVQLGLKAPPHHGPAGLLWMALCMRHSAASSLGVMYGVGGTASGRAFVTVTDGAGKTVEWPVPPADLSFSLRIPPGEEVSLPFLLPEPEGIADMTHTNTFTVNLVVRGVTISSDKGTIGPTDMESGKAILVRCWSLESPGRAGGGRGDDDGLGLKPGDIRIPVPPQK